MAIFLSHQDAAIPNLCKILFLWINYQTTKIYHCLTVYVKTHYTNYVWEKVVLKSQKILLSEQDVEKTM